VKWERGDVREESGKRTEGIGAENGNARKNNPKTQHIWHLGTPLVVYRPSYIIRKLFSWTAFPSQIVDLYLEPFKRASDLTILNKSPHKFKVFGISVDIPGGYRPALYIFRKLFSCATFASQVVCRHTF